MDHNRLEKAPRKSRSLGGSSGKACPAGKISFIDLRPIGQKRVAHPQLFCTRDHRLSPRLSKDTCRAPNGGPPRLSVIQRDYRDRSGPKIGKLAAQVAGAQGLKIFAKTKNEPVFRAAAASGESGQWRIE